MNIYSVPKKGKREKKICPNGMNSGKKINLALVQANFSECDTLVCGTQMNALRHADESRRNRPWIIGKWSIWANKHAHKAVATSPESPAQSRFLSSCVINATSHRRIEMGKELNWNEHTHTHTAWFMLIINRGIGRYLFIIACELPPHRRTIFQFTAYYVYAQAHRPA